MAGRPWRTEVADGRRCQRMQALDRRGTALDGLRHRRGHSAVAGQQDTARRRPQDGPSSVEAGAGASAAVEATPARHISPRACEFGPLAQARESAGTSAMDSAASMASTHARLRRRGMGPAIKHGRSVRRAEAPPTPRRWRSEALAGDAVGRQVVAGDAHRRGKGVPARAGGRMAALGHRHAGVHLDGGEHAPRR